MSTHVKEHCRTPRKIFKSKGTLWMCSCGKVWRLTGNHSMTDYERTTEAVERAWGA